MPVELQDRIESRSATARVPRCRFCAAPLRNTFVDLGMSPLCESYVPLERLGAMEPFYPLHVRVCDRGLLVQLEEVVAPDEIFTEYAYFSSYSDSWVAHARDYLESAVERFGLDGDNLVLELARVSFAEGSGPDKRSYQVDCSKLARVLPEARPQWTVRRGAEELRDATAGTA
jgi:hypothetical protein